MSLAIRISLALAALAGLLLLFTFERPPMVSTQLGYRGTGLQSVVNPRLQPAKIAANQLPAPVDKTDLAGQKAKDLYQNVPVLGELDANEFLRLMAAITEWVSPDQGCTYCHTDEGLESDKIYTKVVSRKMLQMTQQINANWKSHVVGTGVTCWTCHRGQPVPANIWFAEGTSFQASGALGNRASQNAPSPITALAALPHDVFTPFLQESQNIRVTALQALPGTDNSSIKQAEWTYGLMFHLSQALGVNCDFCHNSRLFSDWSQSPPQRATAWYGIRMVRELNNTFLGSLKGVFPAARLGPTGDVAKVNCATCHQGVNKPLYGVSMLGDFPELAAPLAAKP